MKTFLQARECEIRDWLRGREYDVIEIAMNDLDDAKKMTVHFRKRAGCIQEIGQRARANKDTSSLQRGQRRAAAPDSMSPETAPEVTAL